MSAESTSWGLDGAKVGDYVVVRDTSGWYERASALHTIARVCKTSVFLDDGSRWTLRGDRWGSAHSSWSRESASRVLDLARLKAEIAEEREESELKAARYAIDEEVTAKRRDLSLDQITRIRAILAEVSK